jgi:hypothetical protein
MGPVSWTYPTEIYPLKVRAKAVSLSTANLWLFNFALAYAVPPGLETIAWKLYFIFGTFNFACFFHVLFMYPETVGRSLEEVEDIFKEGHTFSAWKIGKGVGKKTLADVIAEEKQYEVYPHSRPTIILANNLIYSRQLIIQLRSKTARDDIVHL